MSFTVLMEGLRPGPRFAVNSYVYGSLCESAVERHHRRVARHLGGGAVSLSFWLGVDALKGLVAGDEHAPVWLFVDGPMFKLGWGGDLNILLGVGYEFSSDALGDLLTRFTGLEYDDSQTSRFAIATQIDARTGLNASWTLAWMSVGVHAGFQAAQLGFFPITGDRASVKDKRDVVAASPRSAHLWFVLGPVVRLAVRM